MKKVVKFFNLVLFLALTTSIFFISCDLFGPDDEIPEIDEIGAVFDVSVPFGTSQEEAINALESKVEIIDTEGNKYRIQLTWVIEDYNGQLPGEYTARATLTLPENVPIQVPDEPIILESTVTVLEEPLTIDSVADVDDIEVAYGTVLADAIAALAGEVVIIDSMEDEHTVSITWDIADYNGESPTDYTATGTFALPDGVGQSDPETPLEVTATVTVLPMPHIDDVTVVGDIVVAYGTSKDDAIDDLAGDTTITDSAGVEHTVDLSWDIAGYNGEVPGGYTATGTFALPDGVGQSDPETPLEVTATVTVLPMPHIVEKAGVDNIEVAYGTSKDDAIDDLAGDTTITDSAGVEHIVDLSWDITGYNRMVAGDYDAVGSFTLPPGVTQSDPETDLEVTSIVTVREQPEIETITQLNNFSVVFGTEEEEARGQLPLVTTIVDSEDVVHIVDLDWIITGYDKDTSGPYTATGTFELPDIVGQSDPEKDLKVTVTVNVLEDEQPLPKIVDIQPVADINVPFGTLEEQALAKLSSVTTITDDGNDVYSVNLSWTIISYNGNTPGDYDATATFELPAGVDQADPAIDLEVTATVTVRNPVIESVTGVGDITVAYGTSEADAINDLAENTTITDSAGVEHTVDLTWSITDYDGEVPGGYTATGTFELPDGVDQADPAIDLAVTATVTVSNPVKSVTGVGDITVAYGTSEADAINDLAEDTTITDSAGVEHTVDLTWSITDYDGEVPGGYTATGIFGLPDGVDQDPAIDMEVTATVTVRNPVIVSFDDSTVEPIKVALETTLEDAVAGLAAEVIITDSSGTDYSVSINWDIPEYNGDEAGTYPAEGTFDLPDGVDQSDPETPLEVFNEVTVEGYLDRAVRLIILTVDYPEEETLDDHIDEIYDMLVLAALFDGYQNRIDAQLMLAVFDIMHFIIDKEIVAIMRDGFGFVNYPETLQGAYRALIESRYNNLITENSFFGIYDEFYYCYCDAPECPGCESYYLILPIFAGFPVLDADDYTGPYGLLDFISRLIAEDHDLNDTVNTILGALGSSFNNTISYLEGIDDQARFPIPYEDYSLGASEAKLLASSLYVLRSYANVISALNLGLDFGSFEVVVEEDDIYLISSPFVGGFLQSDPEVSTYMEAAKDDMLAANRLVYNSFGEILVRDQESGFLIADNDVFPDRFNEFIEDLGFDLDNDDGWENYSSFLVFFRTLLQMEYDSIDAGGGEKVFIPADFWNYDNNPLKFVLHYNKPGNWPTEAKFEFSEFEEFDLPPEKLVIAYNPGVFYSTEISLLGAVLDVGLNGEPRLYTVEENDDPDFILVSDDHDYDSEAFYYFKVPDLTFGGFFDIRDYGVIWDMILEGADEFAPELYVIAEDENGAISLYVSEMVMFAFNGDEENGDEENGDEENGDEENGDEENGDEENGDEENGDEEEMSSYPFAGHILVPSGVEIGDTGIISTGSFWLGVFDFLNSVM